MNNITYKFNNKFTENEIKNLYDNAGWISYTNDLPKLMKAMERSLLVVSAWDDEKLVGLIRVVGDGLIIVYIQDILVLSQYKRKGIGSRLLSYVLDNYKDVRQKVLLTDDSDSTRGFYEANGFVSSEKGNMISFIRFN